MVRTFLTAMISLTTLIFWSVVFAQTWDIDVMNLPKLDQYVTDFAWVLDEQTLNDLNASAYKYEQWSWHQFVAVLIPDRQWYELFDISLKIFNDNQIGIKDINDGLLLVVATNEKKIRIMVGYGLEGEMPDVLASKIIEEDVRPLVNSWDFAWAVRAFYARSQQAISSGEWKAMAPEDEIDESEGLIFAVAVFAYFFGRNFRASKKSKSKKKFPRIASWLFSWLILAVAIIVTLSIIPLVVYAAAAFFGYIVWASRLFFPWWPRWGFWGWKGGRGGWGSSFGWFSWGGWFSGGGGAGD